MVREALKIIQTQNESAFSKRSLDLSYRGIIKFYYPLALTSILSLVIQPALTFFMGQGRYALESLAVWPVVNSFVFIFRSFGLSFQEAAISLMGKNRANYHKLKRFAQMIAFSISAAIAIIALSPLLHNWMTGVSGLTESLAYFTYLPVQILILVPAFSVWISFQRAVLVVQRSTGPITAATSIEVFLVIFVMYALIFHASLSAVSAAATALLIGRSGALGYLRRKIFKAQGKNAENN
jgi:O-antigen/teichoic acid export membrane protein